MNEAKLPHVEDLTTNSKLPGQLTENFKVIEQALAEVENKLDKLQKALSMTDDDLNNL